MSGECKDDAFQIFHGDCLEIVPTLRLRIDAVVSDPPYGVSNNCNYQRFTNGLSSSRNFHLGIRNDDKPFDPSPWLRYPQVALFGLNAYCDKLPPGSVYVWSKKSDAAIGKFLSDCELIWVKGGCGVYLFSHQWNGFARDSQKGKKTLHPSQKPIELMCWIMDKMGIPKGATVLDPYMGLGATGVACMRTYRRFIGIEIIKEYYDIAKAEIGKEWYKQHPLPLKPLTPTKFSFDE